MTFTRSLSSKNNVLWLLFLIRLDVLVDIFMVAHGYRFVQAVPESVVEVCRPNHGTPKGRCAIHENRRVLEALFNIMTMLVLMLWLILPMLKTPPALFSFGTTLTNSGGPFSMLAACPHLSSQSDDGREGLSLFKSLGFPKNKILHGRYFPTKNSNNHHRNKKSRKWMLQNWSDVEVENIDAFELRTLETLKSEKFELFRLKKLDLGLWPKVQ